MVTNVDGKIAKGLGLACGKVAGERTPLQLAEITFLTGHPKPGTPVEFPLYTLNPEA